MLAEEEETLVEPKKAPKAGTKKAKPAGPGAIVTGGRLLSTGNQLMKDEKSDTEVVESFEVTGLDDTLNPLTIMNAKSEKVSIGQQVASFEWHPECQFKATFEAITSLLTPRRTPIVEGSDKMHGYATTCYNSLTENQHLAKDTYLTIVCCGRHVNATTQEIEC